MNVNDVRERVSDLVAARLAFTAFNVTAWLRRNGETVYHSEVRPAVHGMYLDGEVPYNNVVVQAPNGRMVILYCPIELDLTTYDHFSPENEAKVNGPIDLSAVGSVVDTSGVTQALGGVSLQSIADVIPGIADGIPGIIAALAPPVSDPDNTCNKDKYGRINLPAHLVRAIGLNPGDKADLCGSLGGFLVYPYDANRPVNDPDFERT